MISMESVAGTLFKLNAISTFVNQQWGSNGKNASKTHTHMSTWGGNLLS